MNIDYFYVLANLTVKKMFLKVMGKTELTVFEMTVHFYVMFFSFLVPEFCISLNSVQFCFVLWRVVDMCHLLLKVLLNSKNVITFWCMVALFFFLRLSKASRRQKWRLHDSLTLQSYFSKQTATSIYSEVRA
jgi:hypothetical protein